MIKYFFVGLILIVFNQSIAFSNENRCSCSEKKYNYSSDQNNLAYKKAGDGHEFQVFAIPKTYIELNNIIFSDKMIFVHIEDAMVATPALHSDSQGFFIEKVWRIDRPCPDDPHAWKCARCRSCNPYYKRCCSICNHDQDDRECQ